MAKLIQLPGGDWLDSECVRSVRALPAEAAFGSGKELPPRVSIACAFGKESGAWGSLGTAYFSVPFPTLADAERFRDYLACKVNTARGKAKEGSGGPAE